MARRLAVPCIALLAGLWIFIVPTGLASAQSVARTTQGPGYWLVGGYGDDYAFNAPYLASPETLGNDTCAAGVAHRYGCVGVATTASNQGYWLAVATPDQPGGSIGALSFQGPSTAPEAGCAGEVRNLSNPVVGVASAPDGAWLAAGDGGVFALCGAPFYGSMGGVTLNRPIVGIAPTADRKGYWEVASDGGVFAFGDASFHGSMGGRSLNSPIVGIVGTSDGGGYWLIAADGGVFAFGDAAFFGSLGGLALSAPIVAAAPTPDGGGYWLAAADGGVFAFGDAPFLGSASGQALSAPIVGIAVHGSA
jgi:hypothetical protein